MVKKEHFCLYKIKCKSSSYQSAHVSTEMEEECEDWEKEELDAEEAKIPWEYSLLGISDSTPY